MASTETLLSSIYKDVKKEILTQTKLNIDSKHAVKLETFLKQIKYLQRQFSETGEVSIGSDFPFARFWSKAEQIAMINYLYQIKPEIFTEGTFIQSFSGSDNQSHQLGEALEKGFARVVFGIAAKATNKNYTDIKTQVKNKKVGNLQVQIPDLTEMGDAVMKEKYAECYNEASKNLRMYNNSNKELKRYFSVIPSVSGKIDNVGLSSEFIINLNVTGMDRDLVLALENATFTAKNYLSTKDLKFGQTNPFRVFATVAPDGIDKVERYKRMVSCFERHENIHTTAPVNFYRLRAIYEITGSRMKYTDKIYESNIIQNLLLGKAARYLIWNTPYGDIRVIPTKKIIKNIEEAALLAMPANWKDALYGQISLPQSALENL